jgi:hypothetical protein
MGMTSSPNMVFDLSSMITPVDGLDILAAPFQIDEIDSIVKLMPVDKAPGPDRFNGLFLKNDANWSKVTSMHFARPSFRGRST